AAVNNALSKKPERARPYFVRARTYLAQANYQAFLDADALPSFEQTIADCRRAALLDPNAGQTWVLLSIALREAADRKLGKGLPADQEYAAIEPVAKRAIELLPDALTQKANLADYYTLRANQSISHGRDPSAYLASVRQLLDVVLTKNPKHLIAQIIRLL